jgi:hypothetical protein
MDMLSSLMMVLLGLAAFSAGAVAQAGRLADPKPRPADLAVMMTVWAGGFLVRSELPWNTWLLTLGWAAPAYLAGRLSRIFESKKESPVGTASPTADPDMRPEKGFKKLGRTWRGFSRRTGTFQARLIYSLIFLFVAAPFGLIAKIKDPLRLRKRLRDSYWIPRDEQINDLERFRRQY